MFTLHSNQATSEADVIEFLKAQGAETLLATQLPGESIGIYAVLVKSDALPGLLSGNLDESKSIASQVVVLSKNRSENVRELTAWPGVPVGTISMHWHGGLKLPNVTVRPWEKYHVEPVIKLLQGIANRLRKDSSGAAHA